MGNLMGELRCIESQMDEVLLRLDVARCAAMQTRSMIQAAQETAVTETKMVDICAVCPVREP